MDADSKLTELRGMLLDRSAERADLRRDLGKAHGDLEAFLCGQSTSVPADDAAAGEEENRCITSPSSPLAINPCGSWNSPQISRDAGRSPAPGRARPSP
jgi:hypothetical protein